MFLKGRLFICNSLEFHFISYDFLRHSLFSFHVPFVILDFSLLVRICSLHFLWTICFHFLSFALARRTVCQKEKSVIVCLLPFSPLRPVPGREDKKEVALHFVLFPFIRPGPQQTVPYHFSTRKVLFYNVWVKMERKAHDESGCIKRKQDKAIERKRQQKKARESKFNQEKSRATGR